MGIRHAVFGSVAVFGVAAAASAQPYTELAFDINNLRYQFSGPMSPAYTGTWDLSYVGGTSELVGDRVTGRMLGGGGPFVNAGTAFLSDFSAQVSFVGGTVTGGSFSFDVNDSASNYAGSLQGSFSPSAIGSQLQFAGGNWSVDGLVVNAMFTPHPTNPGFIGDNVDISKFVGLVFGGSFTNLNVSDPGTGNSSFGDIDIIVAIPLPGSAGLAMAGIGLIAFRRRRA